MNKSSRGSGGGDGGGDGAKTNRLAALWYYEDLGRKRQMIEKRIGWFIYLLFFLVVGLLVYIHREDISPYLKRP